RGEESCGGHERGDQCRDDVPQLSSQSSCVCDYRSDCVRCCWIGGGVEMTRRWRLFGILSIIALWMGAVPAMAADDPAKPTFHKDIEPILQRSCQRCHNPNSVAPMSLVTYQQVRPYAREVKRRTALRNAPWSRDAMPPWFLERNVGVQKM